MVLRACVASAWLLLGSPTLLAQTTFRDGFEASCLVDDDADRLANCIEAMLGTGIDDGDTDDDGIRDGDEVLGTVDGLDLPALGVDPRHKDLLIEHDWHEDNAEPGVCTFHTHKPDATTVEALRIAFAKAPVANPDGIDGINLIQDVGQGGALSGSNFIALPNGIIQGRVDEADFQQYKSLNFAPNREGYFHYVIHAHRYTANADSSGQAEIRGDDMIVSLNCSWNQAGIRNTIMHELGHNLGLRHGGNTHCNRMPNYNSIMNHRYQLSGIDTNCNPFGDGVMAYSTGSRAPLDENNLDERIGLCNGVPYDWNTQDGGFLASTVANVNRYADVAAEMADCGGLHTVLLDVADWPLVDLSVLPVGGDEGAPPPPQVVDCAPVP